MSIETLSFVMIFEGICIVTVRNDTRAICWMGTKISVKPGPRTPSNLFCQQKYHAALILPQDAKRADEI